MVVCLMRISSNCRKIIGISSGILIGVLILLESAQILLKTDKLLEFYNIGVAEWLWNEDSLFLYSNFISSLLLIFSVSFLVIVLDVAVSQESDHFHVGSRSYSLPIYLTFVSFILCVLSYTLSLRISAEFDTKMTNLLMSSYSMYGESRSHRQLIDRIHSEYSCCGVKSIDDFVDLSEIDKRLPTQTKLWPCNEWEYCGVPLSCCKSILCSQKTQLLHDGWDTMNITEKWFNKDGCVKKLDIAYLFLNYPNQYITEFIMILVLGFHVCAMLLTQILITASVTLHGAILDSSNSKIYSNSSYAWLLDVGKPDRASLIKKLNPNLVDHELEKLSSSQKNDNMEQEDPVGEDKADLFTSTKAITTETDGTHLATETADSSAITNSSTIKNVSLISEGAAEKQVASVADVVPSEDNELEKSPAVSDDEVLVYDSDTGAVKKICEKPGGVPKPKKSKAKPKAPKKKTAKNRKPAKKSKGTSKTKNTKGKKPATNAKNQKQRKSVAKPKKK